MDNWDIQPTGQVVFILFVQRGESKVLVKVFQTGETARMFRTKRCGRGKFTIEEHKVFTG